MLNNKLRLFKLLSTVLDIDINKITKDTSPENTESWDSYNALLILSELESEFNVQFTMDEVYYVKSVEDIIKILSKYGIEFEN
jgi:acyl carrier protein